MHHQPHTLEPGIGHQHQHIVPFFFSNACIKEKKVLKTSTICCFMQITNSTSNAFAYRSPMPLTLTRRPISSRISCVLVMMNIVRPQATNVYGFDLGHNQS